MLKAKDEILKEECTEKDIYKEKTKSVARSIYQLKERQMKIN